MMNQMNDPLIQVVAAMQRGENPAVLLQQFARQNPQVSQAMGMLRGKNPQQLKEMAENMAKERGTTVENVARSLGINISGNR